MRKHKSYATQRRERRSRQLVESGLDYFECLECGAALVHAGTHLARVHHMSDREYKLKHAIPLGEKLITPGAGARLSKLSSRPERLEQLRKLISSPKHVAHLATMAKKSAPLISETRRIRMTRGQRLILAERMKMVHPLAEDARRRINRSLGIHVERTCAYCGKEYDCKRSGRAKFCTRDCYQSSRKARIEIGPKTNQPRVS